MLSSFSRISWHNMWPAGSRLQSSRFSFALRGLRSFINRSDVGLCGTQNKPPVRGFPHSCSTSSIGKKVIILASCSFLSNKGHCLGSTLWHGLICLPINPRFGMSTCMFLNCSNWDPARCSKGSKMPPSDGREMRSGLTGMAPDNTSSRETDES